MPGSVASGTPYISEHWVLCEASEMGQWNLSLMQQVYSDETLPHARVFEWHKDWRQRKMLQNSPVHPPRTLPKTPSELRYFTTQSLNCRPNVVRWAEHQQDGLWQEKTDWHNRAAQEDHSGIRAEFLETADKDDTFCSSSLRQMKHGAYSKGKAIPLQAWTGPEGSRRLRLPDFKTVGTWRW